MFGSISFKFLIKSELMNIDNEHVYGIDSTAFAALATLGAIAVGYRVVKCVAGDKIYDLFSRFAPERILGSEEEEFASDTSEEASSEEEIELEMQKDDSDDSSASFDYWDQICQEDLVFLKSEFERDSDLFTKPIGGTLLFFYLVNEIEYSDCVQIFDKLKFIAENSNYKEYLEICLNAKKDFPDQSKQIDEVIDILLDNPLNKNIEIFSKSKLSINVDFVEKFLNKYDLTFKEFCDSHLLGSAYDLHREELVKLLQSYINENIEKWIDQEIKNEKYKFSYSVLSFLLYCDIDPFLKIVQNKPEYWANEFKNQHTDFGYGESWFFRLLVHLSPKNAIDILPKIEFILKNSESSENDLVGLINCFSKKSEIVELKNLILSLLDEPILRRVEISDRLFLNIIQNEKFDDDLFKKLQENFY